MEEQNNLSSEYINSGIDNSIENELQKEKKSNNYNKKLIIMLIIIIILLLLLGGCYFSKIYKENATNNFTGNVDIFEIVCDKNCDCSLNDDPYHEITDLPNTDDNEENNEPQGDISITDGDLTWESTNKLNIFENPLYNYENLIAPLSSNSYQFVIKNSINGNVTYSLKFKETNQYNINMKYRLKKNGKYIAGNDKEWVTYSELSTLSNNLKSSSKDSYVLDWKWFESDNDTQVGSVEASYNLQISLSAILDD